MKKCLFAIGTLLPMLVISQEYLVDWHKIAGGGGTSVGGAYSLSGTIGQLDANGAVTGGNYSLTGGFWALYAIQTPGAPLLRIVPTPTNTAVVAWPASSGPFSLQRNGVIGSTNWLAVTNAPSLVGSENQVIIALSPGAMFFRLKNPD